MAYTLLVEQQKRKGRPPKPAEAKYRMWSLRIPPALLEDVKRWIPEGERSAIVVECLTRAVARKKREAPKDTE